jgi:single-strand DNA-binding protein
MMNGLMIACTGRLGGDPERRFTPGGKSLLTFSVAVDESTTATEDRPAPETQWLRVTVWDQLANELDGVLQKGMPVYLEGKLRHRRWQTPAGETRCGLNVSCSKVEPLGLIGKRAPRLSAAKGQQAVVRAALNQDNFDDVPF